MNEVKTHFEFRQLDKILIKNSIKDDYSCKVTKMNNIVEVQYLEKRNNKNFILKLDKNTYKNLQTGEIKEFNKNKTENKNNVASIKRTLKSLSNLINNNFIGSNKELFITLTYKENMTDTFRLYKDVEKFIKRFKYYLKKQNINFDYINVVEPQERGAWHCHILFKFSKYIFIENSIIENLWGYGYTKTKRIDNVDNIGAYLTAYLTDLDVTNANIYKKDIVEKYSIIDNQNKKVIKGARLFLYPSGMQLYRYSRGIKKPVSFIMKFKDIKKDVVGFAEPTHISGTVMYQVNSNNSNDFVEYNKIIYYNYNLKRIKSQY